MLRLTCTHTCLHTCSQILCPFLPTLRFSQTNAQLQLSPTTHDPLQGGHQRRADAICIWDPRSMELCVHIVKLYMCVAVCLYIQIVYCICECHMG